MTNNRTFLDTSGLLCLFDASEIRHDLAANLFRSATSLVTTSYVLTEFVPLSTARGFDRRECLSFLNDLVSLPRLELVWVDENLHDAAMALLENRLDKNYSLCDAVSFIVMRERSISEALTTDKHFDQEGFVRKLK
jgi:predicted nucleic acid-binding protein